MAKLLILGDVNNNWRLPAETDKDALLAEIEEAAIAGDRLIVMVEMSDNPLQRTRLVINPTALPYWSILEMADDGTTVLG